MAWPFDDEPTLDYGEKTTSMNYTEKMSTVMLCSKQLTPTVYFLSGKGYEEAQNSILKRMGRSQSE